MRQQKVGDDNLTVIMAVESARCLMTIRDIPEFIVLGNIRRGLRASNKEHLMGRVESEIRNKGKLSSQELLSAFAMMPRMKEILD